ncbi:MAG: hypothetical protein JO356_06680 [Acidobacteria bacterium]|nr:hypothetical protein [Acidobacteriota bacterium]
MKNQLRSFFIFLTIWVAGLLLLRFSVSAGELPRVELSADNIQPRPIEDLTAKSVPRDYALAWQSMERALEENRSELLDAYWTGLAKDDLASRIKTQIGARLRTRYVDGGHKLEAVFYSPAGDALELKDHVHAQLQILDEDKVVYQEAMIVDYMVLMTPGADRWLVRDLEALSPAKPE